MCILRTKEQLREYGKKYYLLNKKRIDRRNTEYYLKNKAHVKQQRKGYYLKNKAHFRANLLKWQSNPENKKRIRVYYAAYAREKRKKPEINLYHRSLYNIKHQLKQANKTKEESTFEYLGYSILDLKNSLESKFRGGMNWKNYGSVWELDHVVPTSHLLKTGDYPEICLINSIDNLQPLLKKENRQKGNRLNYLNEKSMLIMLKSLNLHLSAIGTILEYKLKNINSEASD